MPPPNEVWVPFNLDDLADDESIPLTDVDGFVPYLTEKWPPSGRPHRVELSREGRPNPKGTDGFVVFRVPPPEPEPGNTRTVTVDWAAVRPKVPPKKRKKPAEE
ncbi:hypothetical protein [Mycobacteroides chelonae]|uniref:hypothetical protein n=1 Tax=Mycobacteroides chelonae TaxID=1774 RepID=UPI0018B0942D|nr:hypothetical protein [Mycobacteroides chelonae]MBF9519562.1 hypothetical protein [Mycobacteroides chelonae]